MKTMHTIIKLALTFGLVALFWACEQEAINDLQGTEEAVTATEVQDGTKIWEELDVLHAQVQEELNAIPLPENPMNQKIPNPFLPLILTNELPVGPIEKLDVRSYKGDPRVSVDWTEGADLRLIYGYAHNDYYEMNMWSHNYGNEGFIRMYFTPQNDNINSGGCGADQYYRFLIERLDGNNWITVKDESGTLKGRYYTFGSWDMSEVEGTGSIWYYIPNNEQRNKWYRLTIYGRTLGCPNEIDSWRYMTSNQYFQKFDPGF